MKKTGTVIFHSMFIACLCAFAPGCSEENVEKAKETKDVYLFSYFTGNGEDGLHLAISYDGYTWSALNNGASFLAPRVGQAKLMRDPCILLGPDNVFHLVWTAGWWEKGVGIAHSKDLVTWSEQEFLPLMEHEPDAVNCWAPEIAYDETAKHYVIYWATTIPGRFAETDDTGDPGPDVSLNHRLYYVTTADFENYSQAQLLYDHGFSVIDGTVVQDGSRHVMFLKNETLRPEAEKNIRVAYADKLTGSYSQASAPITGDYWAEGPTAIRIGSQWFLYFDKYRTHQFGLLISKDLAGWTDASDDLNMPAGIRHGTAFQVDENVVLNLARK